MGWFMLRRAGGCRTALAFFLLSIASSASLAQGTWQLLSPATSPPPRWGHAMVYDPESGKVVLFGGSTVANPPANYLADTWTFDGTNWQQETPRVSPPARSAAVFVYDKVTRQCVLFGGANSTRAFSDTWVWDGSRHKWTRKNPKRTPPPRFGAMAFQNPATGHAAFFGGQNGPSQDPLQDTWEWSGRNWLLLVTNTSPGARYEGSAANDPARGTVVLFGGIGAIYKELNTWTFDGTDWRLENSVGQPTGQFDAAAAWDPDLQQVIAQGGAGSDERTWAWNGSAWDTLVTGQPAPQRDSTSMTYDEALGHVLLFGGRTDFGVPHNDTWQFVAGP